MPCHGLDIFDHRKLLRHVAALQIDPILPLDFDTRRMGRIWENTGVAKFRHNQLHEGNREDLQAHEES